MIDTYRLRMTFFGLILFWLASASFAAEVNDLNVSAAGNNSAPPDGFPENMAYSEVNDAAREQMALLARFYNDINGALQAAGVANAYTVTLNQGYTGYFQGMFFACEIPASNTGASTINVNGLGAQAVVDQQSSPIPAGTLNAGGIYLFRYDGTNFQLTAVDDTFGNLTIQTNEITANNTNGGIALRPNGTGVVTIDRNGVVALQPSASFAGVVEVKSAGNTDAELREVLFTHQDSTSRGAVGHFGGSLLGLANDIESGLVEILGRSPGPVQRRLFQGDPDGAVTLYNIGTAVADTVASSIGGLRANNTLTGGGFERVLTTSDLPTLPITVRTAVAGSNISLTIPSTQTSVTLPETGQYVYDYVQDVTVNSSGDGFIVDWSIPSGTDPSARLQLTLTRKSDGVVVDAADFSGLLSANTKTMSFASGTHTLRVFGVLDATGTPPVVDMRLAKVVNISGTTYQFQAYGAVRVDKLD